MTDLRTPPVNDGDLFSERARQYARDKPLNPVQILEAGCGWGTGLDLGDRGRQVTGVDMEAPALRAHAQARTDLDTWHLGDLRTVPLPPRAYDVVHAPCLIERVPHAELVLDRFVAALKPGGLLLIRLRDRDTAFGFLDRRLPRRLREPLWNRLGRPDRRTRAAVRAAARASARAAARAGEGAAPAAAPPVRRVPPPPAIYDRVASRQGMQWYCVMRGLVIAEEYTSRDTLDALGAGSGLLGLACRLLSALSRGRLAADHSELTLIIRKPENRFARVI